MNYTTIKIPVETHRLIKSLAAVSNMAQQDLIEKCLRIYEEQIFWEQCRAAYSELSDRKPDQNETDDTKLYENTLADGLDEEY